MELNELLPEAYGVNRNFSPSETFVLVGFYNPKQLEWINKTKLYNARAGDNIGSLKLDNETIGAKYLLLHGEGESKNANKLKKFKLKGPRIFSKQDLINKNYPTEPRQDFYLVYTLDEDIEPEFKSMTWDITKLKNYRTGHGSSWPFSTTLTELMQVLVK